MASHNRMRHFRPRAVGAEGFTLLEVVVATTLMGLIMVVLLQVLSAAIRAQAASWENTQAIMVAERVLQENCFAARLAAATYQGQVGRYDYKVRVTPQYQVSGTAIDRQVMCSVIQITVSWQEWGRVKSVELQTIRSVGQKK